MYDLVNSTVFTMCFFSLNNLLLLFTLFINWEFVDLYYLMCVLYGGFGLSATILQQCNGVKQASVSAKGHTNS